jgi:hypothetical protein
VNTTARHESTGEAGKIHCSRVTCEELKKRAPEKFNIVERGLVEMKGKGKQLTYWLSSGECNNLVNESALKQLELEIQDLLAKTNFDIREQTKNAKKSLGLLEKMDDESSSFTCWAGKSENNCSGIPKTASLCPNATDTTCAANVELPVVQSSIDSMDLIQKCPHSSNTESAPSTNVVAVPLQNESGDSTCRCQIM